MNKVLNLAKVLQKCGSSNEEALRNKADFNSNLLALIFTAAGCVLMFWVGTKISLLSAIGMDASAVFEMLFFACAIVILIMNIPHVVNQFYMSNDLSILMVLPYKPVQILEARILNAIKVPYLISLVLTIPAGLSYAFFNPMPASFILALILAFVCIPILVFSFVSAVIILIMSVAKGLRNKDFLKTIGIILVFALLVLYMILVQTSGEGNQMMANAFQAFGTASSILPINFALHSLMEGFQILSVLEVLGITAAFALVFWLFASKLYVNSALSMQETSSGGKLLEIKDIEQLSAKKSIVKSYFKKEAAMICREPAYLMNGFLYTLAMPILMLVLNILQMPSFGISLSDLLSTDFAIIIWMIMCTIELTFSACSINAIACCPLSREGNELGFLKSTPIAVSDILKAKQRIALVICSLGCTSFLVIGGIILLALGLLPFWAILMALALNIPLVYTIVNFNMIHDLKKPYFDWETEAQMLKKTTGAVSYILLFVGCLAPLAATILIIIFGFLTVTTVNPWLIYTAALAASIVLAVLTNHFLYQIGERVMKKL